MASTQIYQFYSELCDYEPKMWRRFQIAKNITMARLGYILMTLYEMQASHLFCFDVPGKENFMAFLRERYTPDELKIVLEGISEDLSDIKDGHYEILDAESDDEVLDAARTKVCDVVRSPQSQMTFTYDFGDDWNIHLVLEKVITDKDLPGKLLPRVLEGEGFGIIEDCGGAWGLMDIAKAYKKKKGKEYESFREWLGMDDLDLSAFDIDDINFRLQKVPRIYGDIYELQLEPTQRSIDLLNRKYKQ